MWNIAKHLRNITNSHIRHAKRDFVLNELKQNENIFFFFFGKVYCSSSRHTCSSRCVI